MKYNSRYKPGLNLQKIAVVVISILAVGIFLLVGYMVLRPLLSGPSIRVSHTEPTEYGAVTVTGQTERAVRVYLGEWMIPVTVEGTFEEVISIPPGTHTRTFIAEDRFGKRHTDSFTVTRPPHAEEDISVIREVLLKDNLPQEEEVE